MSVNFDRAGRYIIKARDQVGDRRFSRTARSDQRDFLARLSMEANTGQHFFRGFILKMNRVKNHIAAQNGKRDRVGFFANVRRFVQQREHALTGRHRTLNIAVKRA